MKPLTDLNPNPRASAVRRRRIRAVPGPAAWTLPLFTDQPEATAPVLAPAAHPAADEPSMLALHIYWNAAVEAHVLGAAAAMAALPDERAALRALAQAETTCKDLACDLLERVWRIKLSAPPAGSRPPVVRKAA